MVAYKSKPLPKNRPSIGKTEDNRMMNNSIKENDNKSGAHSTSPVHRLFIVWKPEYDLGIPIIDEQHRGIVTIINSLYYGAQSGNVKNIFLSTSGMLHSYADIHFQTEEFFLETIGYPGAADHRLLHQDYTSKLAGIDREHYLDRDPHELMDFLKKWWLGHICEEDMLFKDSGS